jgi:Cdc6-like AAA superfamily ATPase
MVITSTTIKSYFTEHQILILISTLKAWRNKRKSRRSITAGEVYGVYMSLCNDFGIEPIFRSALDPLSKLGLAGIIKYKVPRSGHPKVLEIGYDGNTIDVIEDVLYSDPDYSKYKYYKKA